MRYEGSYPTPIHGVSTLSPRNRARGQASLQENFRSDPVVKLTRRPSLRWIKSLFASATNNLKNHTYVRGSQEFRTIIKADGTIEGFVNDTAVTVTGNLSTYVSDPSNLVVKTINDTTFVIDKTQVIAMLADTDAAIIEKVSHVNITSALNYNEKLVLNWTIASGANAGTYTVSYQVPDIGIASPDFDTADRARATEEVAKQIAILINVAYPTSHTAINFGSSVAVWQDSVDGWLDLKVQTGDGDRSTVTINQTVENVDGLPLYAVHGTRIAVKPNPISEKGIYYLEATGTSDNAVIAATPAARLMEEVVWVETRSPSEPHSFDPTTMPHTIEYDKDTNSYIVGQPSVGWNSRRTGNDDSAPAPSFVGKTLTDLSYFQKRLVLMSENDVKMSETDDIYNWWIASAVQLLVTDPIGIASSAVDTDVLAHVVNHNKDLLITSSKAQFKIGGDSAVTPQTVSMPLTTSYETQVEVPPISMGNEIYFPINTGDSTGIQVYTQKPNTSQDEASPITPHIIGYMPGLTKILVGNSNLNMLAMTTTQSNVNEIFIYEQFKNAKDEVSQQSWSKWILPVGTEILDMNFRNDKLSVLCLENGNVVIKQIDMYSTISINTNDIFLDDSLVLDSSDGDTVVIPTDYVVDANTIVVAGEGTDYPLTKVVYTEAGGTITFDENISSSTACKVYVGKTFRTAYRPTRPFVYDKQGIAITTDKVRVGKFILNVTNSSEVRMKIISPFNTFDDQEFNSRFLGDIRNAIGEVPVYTGDVKFSFSQNADLAEAEFYTEGFLGLTISGISWDGQYYKSSRRL